MQFVYTCIKRCWGKGILRKHECLFDLLTPVSQKMIGVKALWNRKT